MSGLDRFRISKTVRVFLEELRPSDPAIRAKLDYGFVYHRQSVELIELRPRMLKRPGRIESAFAKATFVKARGLWKVYWKRGNGAWFPYEPPTARSLNAFLKLVKADERHVFFG